MLLWRKTFPLSSVKVIKNNQVKKVAKIKKKRKVITWRKRGDLNFAMNSFPFKVFESGYSTKKLQTTMVFTCDSETCW